jgi:coenzyme F420-reducing hydrogenase beta subunit
MRQDHEGFVYPHVDSKSCIECGVCSMICPQKQGQKQREEQTEIYAAYNTNENVRAASTSGGLFSMFAQWVLSQGGVVFGAAFTDTWMVRHEVAIKESEYARFRGSKYVQSDVTGIYQQVKTYLKDDIWVLFSGTPCQIDGLKAYLRKDYEKLLTIDVVCHGVPSPKLWGKFLNWLKKKHNIKNFVDIRLRDKREGWEKCRVVFDFISNSCEKKSLVFFWGGDMYTNLFEQGISLRPSCNQCKYRSIVHPSDVTLGDCWHFQTYAPELFDNKGLSMIMLHTEKGKQLFKEISTSLVYKQIEPEIVAEQIVAETGYYSESSGAREFYLLLSILPLEFVALHARRRGVVKWLKTKFKNAIKKILKWQRKK